MKVFRNLAFAIMGIALACALSAPAAPSSSAHNNNDVNYVVKVDWKHPDGVVSSLQVTTVAGSFSLDTVQAKEVNVGKMQVPATLKLTGTLTVLSAEKGRLKFFLGRTVPYATSNYPGSKGKMGMSYSQMSVGLDSTFVVTFGKRLLVQKDDSGEVSILVTREKD